ncbi:MAG: Flp pilus assembly pilin Flp, partial [Psychromonas sp.]
MNSTANISKQSGLTSVEYAIVAGLISMGVVGGFSDL